MTTPKLPPGLIAMLALKEIRPCPENVRGAFSDESLADLLASVEDRGVEQDITVRPIPADATAGYGYDPAKGWAGVACFEVVDGHRRFRCAQLAKLKSLQCKIVAMSDKDVLQAQLVSFLREPLAPTREADGYRRLVEQLGSAKAAAAATGKSETTVLAWLRLAKCPPTLAAAVDAGTVGRTVAELVCRIGGDQARERAAKLVIGSAGAEPLSYRRTKDLVAARFQRELGKAPFDRKKPLPQLPGVPSCQACPKRVGNLAKDDPDGYAGVRADVCTDPDCYAAKVKAGPKPAKATPARAPVPQVAAAAEPGKVMLVSVDWDTLKHAGQIVFAAPPHATFEELRGGAERAVAAFIADRPDTIGYAAIPTDAADVVSMPNTAQEVAP